MKAKTVIQGTERAEEAEKRLIEELRTLREALQSHPAGQNTGDQETPQDWTAVATLLPGLTTERWQEIVKALGLDSWFAIPCRGAEYPALNRMLERLQELAHESRHDPLTGLMNRRGFEQLLVVEMERSQRFGSLLSLALLDIDDFKQVNDQQGHLCGDQLLKDLAAILETRTRKINYQARLGGDEFAILMPGSSHLEAQAMLVRLQKQLRKQPVRCAEATFPASFSAGVACYQGSSEVDSISFMKLADEALYQAKRQGKDQTACAPFVAEPHRPTQVSAEERAALTASKGREKPPKDRKR